MTDYNCALCQGSITVTDNANNNLITVNVDGHARAAHRNCSKDKMTNLPKAIDLPDPPMLTTGFDPEVIAFAGDWHGNGAWAEAMIYAARANGADAIVQAGDFNLRLDHNFMRRVRHALEATGTELYFVDGNHDDHPELFKWKLDNYGFGIPRYGGTGVERLHYVPRGHRWAWNGKTFMGLGGAVSVDRQWRTPGHSWFPEERITWAEAEFAARPGKVDVMVCHDLCAGAELPNPRKSSGWPEDVLQESQQHREVIQAVVDDVKPDLFLHGHFHARHDQMVGNMRVVSLDMDGTSHDRNMIYFDGALKEITPKHHKPPVSDRLQRIRDSLTEE